MHVQLSKCYRLSEMYILSAASLVAEMVNDLPALQETWVPSLGWEDPLEKGMATHSRILAWRIPWTRVWGDSGSWWWTGRPGVLQSVGSQRVRHDWATELTDWYLWAHRAFSFETYFFSFIFWKYLFMYVGIWVCWLLAVVCTIFNLGYEMQDLSLWLDHQQSLFNF